MPKVTIYIRNRQTREYERADPRTIYPEGTIWCLRYEQDGKRKRETLSNDSHAPGCGMTYHLARSTAKIREGELELQKPAAPVPISVRPSRVKITDAVEAYIADLYRENNLVFKTIQSKQFELKRWAGVCGKTFMDELTRADMLAFRDWLRREDYAPVDRLQQHDERGHVPEAQPATEGCRSAQASGLAGH